MAKRRPRSIYILHRRYRLLERWAAVIGGAVGLGFAAFALFPPLMAGERVPAGSFVIAALLVAALAIIPYALVRWRWRVIRDQHSEE